jgi:PAS domain S-box-containing protein
MTDRIDVLFVDPQPSTRERFAARLDEQDTSLQVRTASDETAALEHVASTSFDCVVSAYELPDGTGIDLLRSVRTRDADLPFVLFAADLPAPRVREAVAAGVTNCLPRGADSDTVAVLADRLVAAVERRERARQLEARERQFEAVVESVHDALIILKDGVIEYANPRVADFGYAPEELIGNPPTTFVAEEDRETVMERYRERLRGNSPKRTYEMKIVTKTGRRVPVEISVGVLEYGGDLATVTAIRNITDRKERTRQLRVLDRVLRHNLHNDMSIIQGYAETIRDETSGDVADDAATIVERSEQLLATVDKEREIVEVIAESPERTDVDVAALCRQVAAGAREAYPDADLTLDLPAEATTTTTRKLERGVAELVENAIVHSDRSTPTVEIGVERGDEAIRIGIADDGPGIPSEEVKVLTGERAIEPLYHGSGLGLWLVNWIVSRSEGTLRFEEQDRRGSRVTIDLPV